MKKTIPKPFWWEANLKALEAKKFFCLRLGDQKFPVPKKVYAATLGNVVLPIFERSSAARLYDADKKLIFSWQEGHISGGQQRDVSSLTKFRNVVATHAANEFFEDWTTVLLTSLEKFAPRQFLQHASDPSIPQNLGVSVPKAAIAYARKQTSEGDNIVYVFSATAYGPFVAVFGGSQYLEELFRMAVEECKKSSIFKTNYCS